jgi:hypothetical protein
VSQHFLLLTLLDSILVRHPATFWTVAVTAPLRLDPKLDKSNTRMEFQLSLELSSCMADEGSQDPLPLLAANWSKVTHVSVVRSSYFFPSFKF